MPGWRLLDRIGWRFQETPVQEMFQPNLHYPSRVVRQRSGQRRSLLRSGICSIWQKPDLSGIYHLVHLDQFTDLLLNNLHLMNSPTAHNVYHFRFSWFFLLFNYVIVLTSLTLYVLGQTTNNCTYKLLVLTEYKYCI